VSAASSSRYFGSWDNAVTQAGFDYSKIHRYKLAGRKTWTKEQIILEIQHFRNIGEDLSAQNMVSHYKELYAAATHYFWKLGGSGPDSRS